MRFENKLTLKEISLFGMVLKLNVISVIESLNVKISEQTFCPSRSPQSVIRLPLSIRLGENLGRSVFQDPLKVIVKCLLG